MKSIVNEILRSYAEPRSRRKYRYSGCGSNFRNFSYPIFHRYDDLIKNDNNNKQLRVLRKICIVYGSRRLKC